MVRPMTILGALMLAAAVCSAQQRSAPQEYPTAWEVPPGDPVALAEAIRKLVESPALATQLQQAGYARAQYFRADLLRQGLRDMIETTFGRIQVPAN